MGLVTGYNSAKDLWENCDFNNLQNNIEKDSTKCIQLLDYLSSLKNSQELLKDKKFSIQAFQLIVEQITKSENSENLEEKLSTISNLFEKTLLNSKSSEEETKLNARLIATLYDNQLLSDPLLGVESDLHLFYLQEWIKQGNFSLLKAVFQQPSKQSFKLFKELFENQFDLLLHSLTLEQRFELACICQQQANHMLDQIYELPTDQQMEIQEEVYDYQQLFLVYLPLFNLSQGAIIEMAKLAAQQNTERASEHIQNFGINPKTKEGQAGLIEIAKLAAQQNIGIISEYIQNFEIDASAEEGLATLTEIAKLAAQQNGWQTSEYIQNYGIDASTQEGQAALIEIAKFVAQQNGKSISAYIQNYGIDASKEEGQAALIEIAKLAAQQNSWVISTYIQDYGIDVSTKEGKAALIEIAKLAAQQNGENTSQYIQDYGIDASTKEGQAALIEIAKLAAQQNGEGTSKYIQNYGIDTSTQEGRAVLIEIAKIAAQQNGEGTSKRIQQYGINASTMEGQAALIEIAKFVAQKNGKSISAYIQNYGIDAKTEQGQATLIEIAKLAVQQNVEGTAQFIQNYEINASTKEGQAGLAEIAKVAAQQDGKTTSQFIQKFRINLKTKEGKAALIEIAKLAAQQNGEVSEFIQKYGIDGKTEEGLAALIEIAKLAAQKNGGLTSRFIQNYGINAKAKEGMAALSEIAKLAAQQNGGGTSNHIQNYGINASTKEGQAILIEIAKLAAQQNGGGTSEYIQRYEIDAKTKEGQTALIEIAKLAAQQNGGMTSLYIQDYGINTKTEEGQAGLIEIAKLAAQQEGPKTLRHLSNYQIHDPIQLAEVQFLAFHQDFFGSLIDYKKDQQVENSNFLPIHRELFSLIEHIQALQPKEKWKDSFPADAIKKLILEFGEAIPLDLKAILPCLTYKSDNKPLDPYIVRNNLTWLLQSLCLLSSHPQLSSKAQNYLLIKDLLQKCASIHSPNLRKDLVFIGYQTLDSKEAKELFVQLKEAKSQSHFFLPHLMSASLVARGVEPALINSHLAPYLKQLDKRIKERSLNEALYRFIAYCHKEGLSSQDLSYLVEIGFPLDENQQPLIKNSKKLKEHLDLLRNIGELAGSKALKKEALEANQNNLSGYFLQLFKEVIPVEADQEFAKEYEATFHSSRNPKAVLQYAASLNKLPEADRKKALKALASYVIWVVKGEKFFSLRRADTEQNRHLQVVFEQHPGLKEHWIQEIKQPLHIAEREPGEHKVNIKQYFFTKIVTDKHIDLPGFKAYLTGQSNPKDLLSEVEQLLKETAEDPFCQLGIQEQTKHLDKIIKLLELPPNHQFLQDLEDLKKMLEKSRPTSQNATIHLTDNPIDLLLCGTEILGSCQRVDGDPKQNKGLLGYLLDGKNRLIAIKGKDGKLIGRSLLRLGWDHTNKKAVLVLPRIYPNNLTPSYQQAILNFAKEQAERLELDLVSVEVGKGDAYPNSIEGLGGPSPFEYVDEADGIANNGVYATRQAHYLRRN